MGRGQPFPLEDLANRIGAIGRKIERAVVASYRHETCGGVTDDGDTQRRCLERDGKLFDQPAGALIGNLGAVGEHRAAILVDNLQIEALLRLLEHDVLGNFSQFRQILQRLAQRCRGQRKFAVDLQVHALNAVAVLLVRGRGVRRFFGVDMRGVLQLGACRKPVGLNDPGIAGFSLHAERFPHRACDNFQLLRVLVGEGDEHHEEAHHQTHQVGEGHEPAMPSGMCVTALFLGHPMLPGTPLPLRPVPAHPRGGASPANTPAAFREPASGSWNRGS